MSDTLKPGERGNGEEKSMEAGSYTGADGRVVRFHMFGSTIGMMAQDIGIGHCPIHLFATVDIRAAAAALTALADELETEVVELDPLYRLVIRKGVWTLQQKWAGSADAWEAINDKTPGVPWMYLIDRALGTNRKDAK